MKKVQISMYDVERLSGPAEIAAFLLHELLEAGFKFQASAFSFKLEHPWRMNVAADGRSIVYEQGDKP